MTRSLLPPGRVAPRASDLAVVCWSVCAAIVVVAMAVHSFSYFFLYDDFAMVRQSADTTAAAIASTPLFGFYRPLPFLLTRAMYAAVGWNAGPYALVAIVVHALNAWLVGLLARMLGLGRRSSYAAVILFLLSASAAEGYFWLSAVFDRLAVSGTLLCLLAGLRAVAAKSRARAVCWSMAGLMAAETALLSKESAVVLPLLVFATLAARLERRSIWRVAGYLALVSALVLSYLVVRRHFLPDFSGAYGNWWTLARQANLPSNAMSFVKAVIQPPLPGPETSQLVRLICLAEPFVMGTIWVMILGSLLRRRPALLTTGLLAAIVSILPVIWAAAAPGTSASGRFLYLAGIWLAILPAAALDVGEASASGRSRRVASAVAAALCASVLYQTASVVYQMQVWRAASRLSRLAIDGMHPYRSLNRRLFIENLPAAFIEGPYVLKDYAFACYFGADFKPSIRVRRIEVRLVNGRPWFAGWLDQDGPRAGEHLMHLPLPISSPPPTPQTVVTSPAEGTHVDSGFTVSGWSVDPAAPFGCGVQFVHVYARFPDGTMKFLGAAPVDRSTRALGESLGTRFGACGWSLRVTSLSPGDFVLSVHPHDELMRAFMSPTTIHLLSQGAH